MKLLRYLSIPFNPRHTIPQLLEDDRKTAYSMLELAIIGALYTVAVYIGYRNGFGAVVFASSLVVPMLLTMWLPEALLMVVFPDSRATPLGGFEIWPSCIDDLRQIAGLLWPLAIATIGIRKSERISKSAFTAILAFIPTAALIFLLIR